LHFLFFAGGFVWARDLVKASDAKSFPIDRELAEEQVRASPDCRVAEINLWPFWKAGHP